MVFANIKYKPKVDNSYKTQNYKYDILSFVDINFFGEKTEFIYSLLENSINLNTKHLDSFIRHQSLPSLLETQFKNYKNESSPHLLQILEIEKIAIQLIFLDIDLASIIRAFITSEYKTEKLLSLKRTNAVVYEGIKKIYGFNSNKDDSFWTKYIRPIATNKSDIYDEFLLLNNEFCKFEIYEDFLSKNRNISDHFKIEIGQLYDSLVNLEPKVVFEKSIQLLELIPKIFNFLTKCLHIIKSKQKEINEKTKISRDQNIENMINLLENSKENPQIEDIILKLRKIQSEELLNEIINNKKEL